MNPQVYEFDAVIHKVPDLDGTYVIFPYDVKMDFGKGRVKVDDDFEGVPYRGSIVNMGVKDGGEKVVTSSACARTPAPGLANSRETG